MGIINEITVAIIKNVKDGESIFSLASKIRYAYSAVYRWVLELERYGVITIIRKGNKNMIKINKNEIYKKFRELDSAVSVIDKDKIFWELIKTIKLKIRLVKGTAATIWTEGGFITGDFYDRIYFVEVNMHNVNALKKILNDHGIPNTDKEMGQKRPLVIIETKEDFKADKKNGLPVLPLTELINWCKDLELDNILEQLDSLYHLGLKAKYAEVSTNV